MKNVGWGINGLYGYFLFFFSQKGNFLDPCGIQSTFWYGLSWYDDTFFVQLLITLYNLQSFTKTNLLHLYTKNKKLQTVIHPTNSTLVACFVYSFIKISLFSIDVYRSFVVFWYFCYFLSEKKQMVMIFFESRESSLEGWSGEGGLD